MTVLAPQHQCPDFVAISVIDQMFLPQVLQSTIVVPVLDHLLAELEKRFDIHQRTALQGLYLVPSLLVPKEMDYISPKIGNLVRRRPPSPQQSQERISQLVHQVERPREEHGFSSLPTSLFHTLPQISSLYPNIKALLALLCTLPITSCTVEWSFSVSRLL